MSRVIVHATVTLDGFIADADGGVDWMFDVPAAPEDEVVVRRVMDEIGAVVDAAEVEGYSTSWARSLGLIE